MSRSNLSEDDELFIQLYQPSEISYGKETSSRSLKASLYASLATLSFGYAIGYTSPLQKHLQITKDNKDGKLTSSEFATFASLLSLGAIVGGLLAFFMIKKLGRRYSIILTSFFYSIGWALIISAQSPTMFYIGRFVSGVGAGISSLCVSMYIIEISSFRYRGAFGTLQQLSITFGVFLAYVLGTLVSWQWSALFAIVISFANLVLMMGMPESPRYYVTIKQRNNALVSLKWLRGIQYDTERELEEMEESLGLVKDKETFKLKDFKTRSFYLPLLIGVMAMVFQQFCGINGVMTYCEEIFRSANVKNSELVAIIVSIVQIVFTLLSCLLVDRSGRRVLLMISGFVMFVCMFSLGVYYDITIFNDGKEHHDIFHHRTVPISKISWLATLCVMLFITAFSIGWGPIPWILMSELFSPKARALAGAMVNVVNWGSAFIIMKFFIQMQKAFYPQGLFWFYGGFSLLSFLFTIFFIPETKGKTLEEIEEYFSTGKIKTILWR